MTESEKPGVIDEKLIAKALKNVEVLGEHPSRLNPDKVWGWLEKDALILAAAYRHEKAERERWEKAFQAETLARDGDIRRLTAEINANEAALKESKASLEMEEAVKGHRCAAMVSKTDPPVDCNFPFCSCIPIAQDVLEAALESGWLDTKSTIKIESECDMLREKVRVLREAALLVQEAYEGDAEDEKPSWVKAVLKALAATEEK